MSPSPDQSQKQITVYGADWCHDTRDARARLAELGIDYRYVNIDQDAQGKELVERLQEGGSKIPTILFGEGETPCLIEPSQSELDDMLRQQGLQPS